MSGPGIKSTSEASQEVEYTIMMRPEEEEIISSITLARWYAGTILYLFPPNHDTRATREALDVKAIPYEEFKVRLNKERVEKLTAKVES
jgi:hypothetical protein